MAQKICYPSPSYVDLPLGLKPRAKGQLYTCVYRQIYMYSMSRCRFLLWSVVSALASLLSQAIPEMLPAHALGRAVT